MNPSVRRAIREAPGRCPGCGRRSWRYRKTTDELVCRACKHVISRKASEQQKGRPIEAEAEAQLALEYALTRLDLSIRTVLDDHAPKLGVLVPVLGIVTAALLGAFAAQNVVWPWAAAIGLAAGLVVTLVLWLVRFFGFVYRHPTLADLRTAMNLLSLATTEEEERARLDQVIDLTFRAAQEYLDDEAWNHVTEAMERADGQASDHQ